MALFDFRKKKEEKKCCCCCCSSEPKTEEAQNTSVPRGEVESIKVLGAGCKSCHAQYENAKSAVSSMGLNVEVEYVTDMEKIMHYGVMTMPAIVVNEKVVSFGKVLKPADVENLLKSL